MARRDRPGQRCFIFLTLSSILFLAGCLYGWRFETPVYWTSLTGKISSLKSLTHSVIFSSLLGSPNVTQSPAWIDNASISSGRMSGAEFTYFYKTPAFQEVGTIPPSFGHDLNLEQFIEDIRIQKGAHTLKNTHSSLELHSTQAIKSLQHLSSASDYKTSPGVFPTHGIDNQPMINSRISIDTYKGKIDTSQRVKSKVSIDILPRVQSTNSVGHSVSKNSTDFVITSRAFHFTDTLATNVDNKTLTNDTVTNVRSEIRPSVLLNALTPILPTPKYASNTSIPDKNETFFITINHENGRLGNKLFKYASLLGIAHATGRHAFVAPYSPAQDLAKIFCVSHVENHGDTSEWTVVTETKYGYFDPIFDRLPDSHVIIDGYVQSWKYFAKIQNMIRQEFALRPAFRDLAKRTKDEIRHRLNRTDLVFVGVHVRQRDAYSNPNTCEAPRSFFTNAFNKLRALLPGKSLVFVVAGNNLDWCRENLRAPDVVVLDRAPAEIHFAVLASCDHSVVSVGSYGWWAAWLSGGLVVFYKKFPLAISYEAKGFVYEDYYQPSWYPVDD